MGLPKWSVIWGALGVSSILVGGMGLMTKRQFEKYANEADFIQRAMKISKRIPELKQLVGEDFEFGRVKLDDGFGKLGEDETQLKLPIVGSQDNAFLYLYARRKKPDRRFRLYKMEAQFSKVSGKKLIILDRSKEDPSTDSNWDKMQAEIDAKVMEERRPKSKKEIAEAERQRIASMTDEERKRHYIEMMKDMKPKD